MSQNDPRAACDRLVAIFERARAIVEENRSATDDAIHAPVVPFVVALLRMRVRPALAPGWLAADPVHVVMFGGTNSGKSTALNVLLGRAGAGMGVRARLSQHPEAYRPAALGDRWLDDYPTRFVGYGRHRDAHPPRQSDEELRRDGYRPALAVLDSERLPANRLGPPATPAAILWDSPDFSTEEATTYLGTVLDLAALADVVVMAVTDESYADDRGNILLRMVADSGVALHVVANKLSESRSLLDDLSRTLGASAQGRASIHRLPHVRGLTPEDRLKNLLATPDASTFRDAIAREAARGPALKRQTLRGALEFIKVQWDGVLQPLAEEAAVAARWGTTVDQLARDRVLETYRRDYLTRVEYVEFGRALTRLVDLLQVPGLGPVVAMTGQVVRAPIRLAAGWVRRVMGGHVAPVRAPAEREVVDEAIGGWIAAIKAEAQSHAGAGAHPAWSEIARQLDSDEFLRPLLERFEAAFNAYRGAMDEVIGRRAEGLITSLEENRRRLNTLRGVNVLIGVVVVGLAVASWGFHWSDLIVVPIVVGVSEIALEWALGRYLATKESGLAGEQFRAMEGLVEGHLARPVRDLFAVAVGADDLSAARRDLALVSEAAEEACR